MPRFPENSTVILSLWHVTVPEERRKDWPLLECAVGLGEARLVPRQSWVNKGACRNQVGTLTVRLMEVEMVGL